MSLTVNATIEKYLSKRLPQEIINIIYEYYNYNKEVMDEVIENTDLNEEYYKIKFVKKNKRYNIRLLDLYEYLPYNATEIKKIYKTKYGFIFKFCNNKYVDYKFLKNEDERRIIKSKLEDNDENIMYYNENEIYDCLKKQYEDVFDKQIINFMSKRYDYTKLMKIVNINKLIGLTNFTRFNDEYEYISYFPENMVLYAYETNHRDFDLYDDKETMILLK